MALLTARKIRHNFGGLRAIDDFNLDLHQGELMGLIGPNGAGKTTVFNLITGVYRASEGSIRYRDEELVGRTPHEITARRIARTFQNIRLFRDLSVLDNVRIAHFSQSRYSPIEALLHAGRFRREEERIVGHSRDLLAIFKLEHLAGETASSLPYGHQRRLEIARALATRPELLLLDEPAAGMNPSEIDQLMEFIRWIRSEFQLTILLIEHQMKLVMGICERIKVLDFGRTLAEGPPEVVRSDPLVLEAYLGEKVAG
jgi:branched-chain amino acid transport system ATP-binding protein